MPFKFYTNAISQATRGMAAGIFTIGLLLVGFGMIIFALPELFAFLAAGIFFLIGMGFIITAAKMLWVIWKINRNISKNSDGYRENVTIRYDDTFIE